MEKIRKVNGWILRRSTLYRRPTGIFSGIFSPKKLAKFQVSHKIRNTLPDMFKDGLICTSVNSHKGTCGGDSGAPLMIDEFVDYDSGEKIFKLIPLL